LAQTQKVKIFWFKRKKRETQPRVAAEKRPKISKGKKKDLKVHRRAHRRYWIFDQDGTLMGGEVCFVLDKLRHE